jgi:hypothetical protein
LRLIKLLQIIFKHYLSVNGESPVCADLKYVTSLAEAKIFTGLCLLKKACQQISLRNVKHSFYLKEKPTNNYTEFYHTFPLNPVLIGNFC